MISFRYHVVSLVAVLLALAVGIALGSGPLQRTAAGAVEDVSGRDDATAAELARAREGREFARAYAAATGPALVDKALKGRAVTVLSLPGADEDTVAELTGMVERAGGAVTARLAMDERFLDVGNRQLVTELATQMRRTAKKVEVPPGASGYDQMARLLTHAVASTATAGRPVDGAGRSILAGLTTADLVAGEVELKRRGSLVAVVAGEPRGSDDQRLGAGGVVTALVTALDKGSDGVVLAAPAVTAARGGVVEALRSDPAAAERISTVDALGEPGATAVTVLALEAAAQGHPGQFGITGGDGAVPGGQQP